MFNVHPFGRPLTRALFARIEMLMALFLTLAMLLLIFAAPAHAGSTIFLTERNAGITFPISPPNRATSGPGAIDNMVIGATNPQAGSFTTFKSNDIQECATYYVTGVPAATSQAFFIALRAYKIVSISEVHATAAGGVSTLGIYHDTGTQAPGAGVDMLSADFNLNGTINTVQNGALSATPANLVLAAGDRISVKYTNAIQSSAGIVVSACLAPQ